MEEVPVMVWVGLIVALCGVLGYRIGNAKDAGGDGALLGILLGPLGLILAALYLDNRARCHMCHGRLDGEPILCPHCQTDLAAFRKEQATALDYQDSLREKALVAASAERRATQLRKKALAAAPRIFLLYASLGRPYSA